MYKGLATTYVYIVIKLPQKDLLNTHYRVIYGVREDYDTLKEFE